MSAFPNPSEPAPDGVMRRRMADEAAAWVLRCDRGLTPKEQDEFSSWLAADRRHGVELGRHRRHWTRLDRLARWVPEHSERPNPDLLAPAASSRLRRWAVVSALAASLTVAAILGNRMFRRETPKPPPNPGVTLAAISGLGPRRLADGTIVELNRDATLTVQFTAAERRVRLDRGEAHFTVKKDPVHPFIVNAAGIDVRAVGTAFNVRVAPAVVEVLVTEGTVQVAPHEELQPALPDGESSSAPELLIPTLEARQRAVISRTLQPQLPQIATLTDGEIERVLAWQDRLLDFTAAPLEDVVAEFNRRNVVQLVLADRELASVRISAAFRSDNIDGFVRLLEAGFGTHAERRGDSEIVLRKAK
jgi:transmembrane sensor